MSVTTKAALLDQLKESDILSPEQLKRAENLIGDEADPRRAARALYKADLITRWQANQLLKGSSLLSLGKYVLLDRLPWGSNHAVFLATHPMMERKVALNVLDKASSGRSDSRDSFLSDARAIASLDHRHLIHVYDIDEAQGRCFLVMEYVNGSNLHDRVKADGPQSIEASADIIRQIAEGLAHAHANKLIHGGLRPTNVILDDHRTAKIIDLGLSKFDDLSKTPSSGAEDSKILSIADYLSPEQAAGKLPCPTSDIYSLGCIAFFMLAGEAPYGKGSYTQRLQRHQHDKVPEIRKARKDVPEGLATIVAKMMAKDPDERYASAKEIVKDLEKWWTEYAAKNAANKPKPKPIAAKPAPTRGASPPQAAAPPPKKNGQPVASSPIASKPAAAAAPAAKAPAAKSAPAKSSDKPVDSGGFPAISIGPAQPKSAAANAPTIDVAAPKGKTTASTAAPALNSKSKSAPQAAPQPAKAAETKKPLPLAMILGGAGALLLLLLLLGGGTAAYFVFFSGSDEDVQVVANENPTEVVNEPANLDPAEPADGEAPGENPVDGEPAEGEDNLPVPDGEDKPPVANPDGEPMPPDGEPPVEEPPVDPKPEVSEPKEPEPKEAPPKPKPKPVKPKNPFTALAAAADLPKATEAGKPTSLGKLQLPTDVACYIDLLGGENVAPKEGNVFTLDRGNNGLADREWEFKLAAEGQDTVVVANMALGDDGELQFQWTPEAANRDASPYLRNCQLNLRTTDFEHFLTLRQPQQVTGLPFRLDGKLVREKFEIDNAPREANIFIEFTGVEGAEKYEVAPKEKLTVDRDSTFVSFGEGIDQRVAAKVESVMGKDLQLTVTPFVKVVNNTIKFNQKQLQGEAARLIAGMKQLQTYIEAAERANKDTAQRQFEVNLKTLEEQYSELEKLGSQLEALNAANVYIKFRVVYSDGVNDIPLVIGDLAPEAPAAAANPVRD